MKELYQLYNSVTDAIIDGSQHELPSNDQAGACCRKFPSKFRTFERSLRQLASDESFSAILRETSGRFSPDCEKFSERSRDKMQMLAPVPPRPVSPATPKQRSRRAAGEVWQKKEGALRGVAFFLYHACVVFFLSFPTYS